VAPLRLEGLRGKHITPSVGWEVPVRSRWLGSESGMECMDAIKDGDKANVCSFIL
jgi:hypothetical protein